MMIELQAIPSAPTAALLPSRFRFGPQAELIALGQADAIDQAWRALLAEALDDTPFLAPEFLLPAAIHAADGEVELLAIWEGEPRLSRLLGLVPLAGAGAPQVWTRPRQASLWRHPLQPFALPLLAGPEPLAGRAVGCLFDWLAARQALSGFDAARLPAGSAAARLLADEARARALPLHRRRGGDLTRGLHFKPRGLQGAVDRVAVAAEPAALHAALEQLLCLDRAEAPGQAILLRDPLLPALLRAAVRGFGVRGSAVIALADEADARAGALVLVGRGRGYLWRLFGPDAGDPAIEAALAVAAERRLGLPIVAASARPLAGAGAEPVPTESLSIGLRPELASVMGRMRMWLGSGLF